MNEVEGSLITEVYEGVMALDRAYIRVASIEASEIRVVFSKGGSTRSAASLRG